MSPLHTAQSQPRNGKKAILTRVYHTERTEIRRLRMVQPTRSSVKATNKRAGPGTGKPRNDLPGKFLLVLSSPRSKRPPRATQTTGKLRNKESRSANVRTNRKKNPKQSSATGDGDDRRIQPRIWRSSGGLHLAGGSTGETEAAAGTKHQHLPLARASPSRARSWRGRAMPFIYGFGFARCFRWWRGCCDSSTVYTISHRCCLVCTYQIIIEL
jgi:hypothetical protein